MCTIGNKFINNNGGILTFKQCDLEKKNNFLEPQINEKGDILYMPFLREQDGVVSKGPWAGVNNHGVSFVAADNYVQRQYKIDVSEKKVNSLFEKYTSIISDFKDAKSAADSMLEFYKNHFKAPDIILIADKDNAFFIEAYGKSTISVQRSDGHFAATNHMRLLPGAVRYEDNHSTYLRLHRAETILQSDDSINVFEKILSDQYFGKSVCSICREKDIVPIQEDPYFTQASVAFYVDSSNKVNMGYLLNGNPRTKPMTYVHDVFGKYIKTKNLTKIKD